MVTRGRELPDLRTREFKLDRTMVQCVLQEDRRVVQTRNFFIRTRGDGAAAFQGLTLRVTWIVAS